VKQKLSFLPLLLAAPFITSPSVAEDDATSSVLSSWAGITLDYLATPQGGYGFTIAMKHFDDYYPNWGYYGGYARMDDHNLNYDRSESYDYQRNLFRLGISYSLTNDLHWYFGGVNALDKGTSQVQIVNPCVGCTPLPPETTYHNQWGGEIGFRYAYRNLLLGIGYDSVTGVSMFSLGYRDL